jgi:hypothetical protein
MIAEKLLIWTLRKGGGSTVVGEQGSRPWQVVAPRVLETISRPFDSVASGVEQVDVPVTAI